MSRCKLRTPWLIHFKLRIVIGIDSLTVCILFGEISIFHSRVMGLYSSNCRRFFVCHTVNWEPLGQFTSNFAQLLELIVLRSVYFLVKFRFFIQELWERKSLQILYECWQRTYHALLAQLFIFNEFERKSLAEKCIALLCNQYYFWHKRDLKGREVQNLYFLNFHPLLMCFFLGGSRVCGVKCSSLWVYWWAIHFFKLFYFKKWYRRGPNSKILYIFMHGFFPN